MKNRIKVTIEDLNSNEIAWAVGNDLNRLIELATRNFENGDVETNTPNDCITQGRGMKFNDIKRSKKVDVPLESWQKAVEKQFFHLDTLIDVWNSTDVKSSVISSTIPSNSSIRL